MFYIWPLNTTLQKLSPKCSHVFYAGGCRYRIRSFKDLDFLVQIQILQLGLTLILTLPIKN